MVLNLNKEIIHEMKVKSSNTIQVTLDDDFNVPDSKADIDSIVKEHGVVVHDEVKVAGERADVNGKLMFSLLYIGAKLSDGRHMPEKMTGEMPFSEKVNLSEPIENASCTCVAVIDDLSVKAINSRKISVRAIVSITVICEEMDDVMAAVGIETDDSDMDVQVLATPKTYAQMALQLHDNLRIRSSVSLPAEKPEIGEVIWEDIDVRNMNNRLTDAGVTITGELSIFIMYKPQDESLPIQWYDTVDTFEENLDVSGCNSELIGYIRHSPVSTNVEIKPDYDGEQKDISIELVMNIDIKAYEECEKNIIDDMYLPHCELQLEKSEETLYQLLVHNNSKCRATGQQTVASHSSGASLGILQICNCTGSVQIDNMEVTEDGLVVDGAILANVFYVTENDRSPMGSIKIPIPFSEKVLLKISKEQIPDVVYHVITGLDQLTAVMTGAGQIEIKGVISIDVLCFVKKKIFVIKGCDVCTEVEEKESPVMIGYFSDGKSRMWDIAKKYHTTTALIREMNPAATEHLSDTACVKRSEKLLLVKAARQ